MFVPNFVELLLKLRAVGRLEVLLTSSISWVLEQYFNTLQTAALTQYNPHYVVVEYTKMLTKSDKYNVKTT